MKRLLALLQLLIVSRAVTPLVMLFFLVLYIGIAFFSDEPLLTLMAFTRNYFPLAAILALIPVNCAVRLVMELCSMSRRRAVMGGGALPSDLPKLFAETVHLPGTPPLAALQTQLEGFGYHTRLSRATLAAWQGTSLSPARILFLAAMVCLFSGILISTTTRISNKVAVIEGEPFPFPQATDRVERITFAERRGVVLDKTLAIAISGQDGTKREFGIYPPALYHGLFVYPRYLGVAPLIHFAAPDLKDGFSTYFVLTIYPPGKEDSAEIPGTGYRIVFSMAEPDEGEDPFRSGRMNLLFRILQGDKQVSSGSVAMGSEFVGNGYRLRVPEFKRVVATDLVRDYGVIPIWVGALLLGASTMFWLPVRLFSPRREMLFMAEEGVVHAFSRAEGRRVAHGGVFHEALDLLDAENSSGSFASDEKS